MARTFDVKTVALLTIVAFASGVGAGAFAVKGTRDFVAGLFESERPADLSSPKVVKRPGFRFEYPKNWKIDTADKDYDADHSFTVESPGSSIVMFEIADGDLELGELLQLHEKAQTQKLVKNATRTPFDSWAGRSGKGVILKGKMLGFLPGSERIFCFADSGRTFTVIEVTYDEDRQNVAPGFALIERTFKVSSPTSPLGSPALPVHQDGVGDAEE